MSGISAAATAAPAGATPCPGNGIETARIASTSPRAPIFGGGSRPGGAMTLDEKLEEALKETFPASDAFWLAPETALLRQTVEDGTITKCSEPIDRLS
jgi:hypothetical protein